MRDFILKDRKARRGQRIVSLSLQSNYVFYLFSDSLETPSWRHAAIKLQSDSDFSVVFLHKVSIARMDS